MSGADLFEALSLRTLDLSEAVDQVRQVYGAEAPTKVAYRGLNAWCEGDKEEFQFWVSIFERLRN